MGADEVPDAAATAKHSSMLRRCRLQDADEPCLVAVREAALRAQRVTPSAEGKKTLKGMSSQCKK